MKMNCIEIQKTCCDETLHILPFKMVILEIREKTQICCSTFQSHLFSENFVFS